jgi:hypothetical protein
MTLTGAQALLTMQATRHMSAILVTQARQPAIQLHQIAYASQQTGTEEHGLLAILHQEEDSAQDAINMGSKSAATALPDPSLPAIDFINARLELNLNLHHNTHHLPTGAD